MLYSSIEMHQCTNAANARMPNERAGNVRPHCVHSCIPLHSCILRRVLSPRPATARARKRSPPAYRRGCEALQPRSRPLAAQEKTLLGDLRKLEVERQIKVEQLRQLDADGGEARGRAVGHDRAGLTNLEAEDCGRAPGTRAAPRRDVQARAGALRAAAAVDGRRAPHRQASRTVAALAKARSRSRRRASAHAGRAHGDARVPRGARHAASTRCAPRHGRAEAEVERARRRPAATRFSDIDRQRDLNAQLAGELQAAQQKLQAALRVWPPGRPATEPASSSAQEPSAANSSGRSSGAIQSPLYPAGGRSGTAASNGDRDRRARGPAVVAVTRAWSPSRTAFTGFGNLVIVDHGAQTFSLYGNLRDIGVKKGATVVARPGLGTVGASPTGPAGPVLRIARRRSAGRSLTMAQEER